MEVRRDRAKAFEAEVDALCVVVRGRYPGLDEGRRIARASPVVTTWQPWRSSFLYWKSSPRSGDGSFDMSGALRSIATK